MSYTLRCDWLPERARWSYLSRLGLPACVPQGKCPESHMINALLTKLVLSRWRDTSLRTQTYLRLLLVTDSRKYVSVRRLAGCWPRFVFHAFMHLNLANIQPSWPHTWSISHISKPFWLRWQSELDASYSHLQENEIKDPSALWTKVCRWLFIIKSAVAFEIDWSLCRYETNNFRVFPFFFDILSDVRRKKTSVRYVDFLFFIISEERKSNLLRRQFEKSILTRIESRTTKNNF